MAPTEAAIEAKAAPAADVILHGPRGNGKTVLLDVIGDRLEQAGAQVVRVTAHEELASWRALANALVPDDGWRGALRRLSERAGGVAPSRLSLFGVRLDLSLNQADGPSARQMLLHPVAPKPPSPCWWTRRTRCPRRSGRGCWTPRRAFVGWEPPSF